MDAFQRIATSVLCLLFVSLCPVAASPALEFVRGLRGNHAHILLGSRAEVDNASVALLGWELVDVLSTQIGKNYLRRSRLTGEQSLRLLHRKNKTLPHKVVTNERPVVVSGKGFGIGSLILR